MVNDLKQLLRENVADAPPDYVDVGSLVTEGRRRARSRRTAVAGGVAVLAVGVVAATAVTWPQGTDTVGAADQPPAPHAPTLRLDDAQRGVAGRDYEVLASHTNEDLDFDNGQYFDGVTDDGLILFRDGPRDPAWNARFALMDPSTGAKDWLPDPSFGQAQTSPVELGAHRLILLAADGKHGRLVAHVFDRDARQWSSITWPGLPQADILDAVLGSDGRLYVPVPATQGQPPEGGWPTGSDSEADDAGAEGDTNHLWSVSLTDRSDVRDEALTVGDVAFTDTSMVWTDSTNGDAGLVHVRDLSTGDEHSFDPGAGERCNVLTFGVTDDRVVLGEYCGTYDDGVRDDRVQILTTGGDQVVTLQDSGIEGGLAGEASDVVTVSSYEDDRAGTYVYDLGSDRFLRVSDGVSKWAFGGSASDDGRFLWDTPANNGHGATQHLGQLLP